ncbi:MAG: transporter associated domain-containing protein [Alphaproteobacteria bacterium]
MALDSDIDSAEEAAPTLWERLKQLVGRGDSSAATLKESFEDVLDENEALSEALSPVERSMLTNIVSIRDARVDDAMVPRADIVSVPHDTSLADLIGTFHKVAHSRLPIYRDTPDDIIGMVHIKDVIGLWENALNAETESARSQAMVAISGFAVTSVLREVLYIPPSLPVLDLLLQMQANRVHMAMVIDEFGGTDGLVTIEDLIEEIVGDITDEHEDPGPSIAPMADGSWIVDARLEVEALEEELGLSLIDDDDDVDTVGGLVVGLIGRLPVRGEIVRHRSGVAFEVREADPRRVRRLSVRRIKAKASPPDTEH